MNHRPECIGICYGVSLGQEDQFYSNEVPKVMHILAPGFEKRLHTKNQKKQRVNLHEEICFDYRGSNKFKSFEKDILDERLGEYIR